MTVYRATVTFERAWPSAEVVETARLRLEPLRVEHAEEMAPLLDDQSLHEFIGGHPATREELQRRYAQQIRGCSADGTEGWLNWIARCRENGAAVGTVQATLRRTGGHLSAEIAWVIAGPYQRHGYAPEAAKGMVEWLRQHGTDVVVALIHPDHTASIGVALQLGLRPTDMVVDGEVRWVSRP